MPNRPKTNEAPRGAAKRNYAVANNPASPRLRRGRHVIHPRDKPRGILAKANKSRVPKALRRSVVRLLILGGARSGKSRLAQDIAARQWRRPVYLATAEILDDEMAVRVRLHRQGRARRWRCVEEPLEIAKIIRRGVPGTDGILVDCLTIWLSNVLLKEGRGAFVQRRDELVKALRQARQDVILVANEVGMGVVPEHALGRTFRDLAGWLNQAVAKEADTVVFVTAGLPLVLKGHLPE